MFILLLWLGNITKQSNIKFHQRDLSKVLKHPIRIDRRINMREVPRISVHLKIATGAYILQANRTSLTKMRVDPTCLLCKIGADFEPFSVFFCATIESLREHILSDIEHILSYYSDMELNDSEMLLQLLTDCPALFDTQNCSWRHFPCPKIVSHFTHLVVSGNFRKRN